MEWLIMGLLIQATIVACVLVDIKNVAMRIAKALEDQAEHQRWIEENTRQKQ